jgi:hypothetical protein
MKNREIQQIFLITDLVEPELRLKWSSPNAITDAVVASLLSNFQGDIWLGVILFLTYRKSSSA